MAAFAGVFAGGEAVSCLFAAAAPAQQQSAETIHIAEGAPRSSQKRKQSQVPAGDEQPTKKGKKQRKAAGAAATASGSAAPPSASTQRQAAGRADGKSGQELETAPAEATQARQAAAPPKKQRQRRQQPAQPPQKPARASTATEAERPEDTPAAGVEQVAGQPAAARFPVCVSPKMTWWRHRLRRSFQLAAVTQKLVICRHRTVFPTTDLTTGSTAPCLSAT